MAVKNIERQIYILPREKVWCLWLFLTLIDNLTWVSWFSRAVSFLGSRSVVLQKQHMSGFRDHSQLSVDQYPQLTLHWHFQLTVSWEVTYFRLMHTSQSTLGQHLTDCWSSVDRVLIECQLRCRWSVDQGVDQSECRSRCQSGVSTRDAFSVHVLGWLLSLI